MLLSHLQEALAVHPVEREARTVLSKLVSVMILQDLNLMTFKFCLQYLRSVTLCAVSAAFAACSTSLLCVLLLKDKAKNELFKSDRAPQSFELPILDNKADLTHNMIPKQRQLTSSRDEDAEGVVWLMSFPNSGTSYTVDAVRELTGTTTGTNYGLEGVVKDQKSTPAFPDMGDAENGPFLHIIPGREINTPKLLLTKTHCSGYCSSCMKPEMVRQLWFHITCYFDVHSQSSPLYLT